MVKVPSYRVIKEMQGVPLNALIKDAKQSDVSWFGKGKCLLTFQYKGAKSRIVTGNLEDYLRRVE
ncbi:hypothetical protein phiAS5_ORF0075 [Aeromonas phage phiAS5]|uniref:Uncharacterized protein n=1 Tax=Aeromonas phage phiAS5 TaxID=879630 RepID=E1A2H2_9CAUD|nr:hypothetical protein phiAS5_ORF0075 [Aeromonas phage phiAS5]ADM79918.1 hypothetical protein phiAS5_ORF0075 [Aeromonas phage phiAS5]BES53311.1 hypothetical protein [Aeromonas phage phiWae14]